MRNRYSSTRMWPLASVICSYTLSSYSICEFSQGNSDWTMGGSWGVGGAIRHDIKISYHLNLDN